MHRGELQVADVVDGADGFEFEIVTTPKSECIYLCVILCIYLSVFFICVNGVTDPVLLWLSFLLFFLCFFLCFVICGRTPPPIPFLLWTFFLNKNYTNYLSKLKS